MSYQSAFVFLNSTCSQQEGVVSKLIDYSFVDINVKALCDSPVIYVQTTCGGLKLLTMFPVAIYLSYEHMTALRGQEMMKERLLSAVLSV